MSDIHFRLDQHKYKHRNSIVPMLHIGQYHGYRSVPKKNAVYHNSYYEKFLPTGEVKCIDEEIPFEIPNGWQWERIGNIFETTSGSTPLSRNPDYYKNGNINWVRTTDLNNGILNKTEIQITSKAIIDYNLSILPQTSVCVAMYGGAGTIGKHCILHFDTTINQSVCAIQPNGFCNMDYIHTFIEYQRPFWMVTGGYGIFTLLSSCNQLFINHF